MKRRWVLAVALAIISITGPVWAASSVPAGKYKIDPAHSKVGFEIAHLVISTVEGRFNQFSGDILIGDKTGSSQVSTQIEATSIDTGVAKRDDHLRSPDFFDVKSYPHISFKSKQVSWNGTSLKVVGDLTMHGVTKAVTLDGKLFGPVKDPAGVERVAIQASTKIDRKDFGLAWNKVIEAGSVVGDEVTISLKIEAYRQADGSKN